MYQAMMLAAVALIGYLFGRVGRKKPDIDQAPEELQRASQVALQLESIAEGLRHDLARHRTEVEHFKRRLAEAAEESGGELDDQAWQRLEQLAEEVLGPTLQLGGQLSGAYDRIRRQTQTLTNFTGGRRDRGTGLGNGRALEEQLALLLERRSRSAEFSIAMISIASGGGPGDEPDTGANGSTPDNQRNLEGLAAMLGRTLRQRDFAARYGLEEIVVVMPETGKTGARVFGDRVRETSLAELGLVVSCGLAESMPGDSPRSLLARADSALYSARAAGPGRQFVHSGAEISDADAGREAPADGGAERATATTATA